MAAVLAAAALVRIKTSIYTDKAAALVDVSCRVLPALVVAVTLTLALLAALLIMLVLAMVVHMAAAVVAAGEP
jgi:hypothetical protein